MQCTKYTFMRLCEMEQIIFFSLKCAVDPACGKPLYNLDLNQLK